MVYVEPRSARDLLIEQLLPSPAAQAAGACGPAAEGLRELRAMASAPGIAAV